MKTKAFLFDFDDTLINTKTRHYKVICDFIKMHGKSLSLEEYLELRNTNHWSNQQLIKNHLSIDVADFSLFWKLNIENPQYLEYDKEIVDYGLLQQLKTLGFDLYLISLRSNTESAITQFKTFKFSSLFKEFHFLKHSDINPKVEPIRFYKNFYQNTIFIGDSNDDYHAADMAGVRFVGVETGMYNLVCEEKI